MIVGRDPIRVEHPTEKQVNGEPHWFEFRRLPRSELNKARKQRAKDEQSEMAELLRQLGPEYMKALRDDDTQTKRRVLDELEFHISNFDEDVLINSSVLSWSYDIPREEVQKLEEVLDEGTCRWAAETVVALTRPMTEEEEGN